MALRLRHPHEVILVVYCSKALLDLGKMLILKKMLLLSYHLFGKSFYKIKLLTKIPLFNNN